MDERKGKKNMKLSDVFAKHKETLFEVAKQNTVSDEQGRTVVTKDDPWHLEDDYPRRESLKNEELVQA
ncbi:hypothetical protein BU230_08995 [Klebsiella pneumoniae]|nr:hypothetical protein BU230_08995 [Klebsiella pneumoniae]